MTKRKRGAVVATRKAPLDDFRLEASTSTEQWQSQGSRLSEAQIHAAVVAHLRLRAKPDVLFLHVPNGGKRDKISAAILKRMGTLAGAADLLLWHQGNAFALELKAAGGRLSEAQLEFMARFADAGGHICVADSIERALAVLESWQLLRGRAS